MIEELHVQHYLIFDDVSLSFCPGMTALTGETGAGKSLLIDALTYLSGKRMPSTIIAGGQNQCLIELLMSPTSSIQALLEDHGFPCEEQLIIQRTVNQSGKSTIRINHQLATLAFLKELMALALDIHAQHDSLSLFNHETIAQALDQFAQIKTEEIEKAYLDLKQAQNEWDSLSKTQLDEDELTFMKSRVALLEQANIQPGEYEHLNEKVKAVRDISKHAQAYEQVLDLFNRDGGILESLFQASKLLDNKMGERFRDLYYELDDNQKDLSDQLDALASDIANLDQWQTRLAQLQSLLRKYGPDEQALLETLASYQEKIAQMENLDELLEDAKQLLKKAEAQYDKIESGLLEKRKKAAKALEKALMRECQDLMLDKVVVRLDFEQSRRGRYRAHQVRLMVQMNPGLAFQPLEKCASGGELSRLMLAFKVIFQQQFTHPTLLFDEIDTGVSGAVALAMGQKMASLSHGQQVLCVTHLAPVAAVADEHLLIFKSQEKDQTKAQVIRCDDQQRIEQLALLATGSTSELALQAARELRQKVYG